MAVDHRTANISVSHESLDLVKLSTPSKQIRAEVMPQGMGGLVGEAVPPQQHPHFLRHLVGVVS